MAITLCDLKERLERALDDLERRNYGDASQRLTNTISILENNGVTIHEIASVTSKKVESIDREEEKE